MGFRFRKSIGSGPVRVNFSKSGVGFSVGTKGYRVTKKAGGGTRTTASIPGTGISYVKESGVNNMKSKRGKYESKKTTSTSGNKKPKKKNKFAPYIAVFFFIVMLGSCFGNSEPTSSDAPTESTAATEVAESTSEPTKETIVETAESTVPSTAAETIGSTTPTEQVETAIATTAPMETETPATAPPTTGTSETEPIGTTYVLNTNTQKFHEPGCSSVSNMKESNKKVYTGTREEIIAMGYVPCDRCKP